MTPEEVIADFIRTWEGVLSLVPEDNGNWTGGHQGAGLLVGSKYGVTPAALAAHRGIQPSAITKPIMAALTLDEAAGIGRDAYYDEPGIAGLDWNRVTASVLDFGWGAGPGRAIRKLQTMIGATADGMPGTKTQAAYRAYLNQYGEERVAKVWAQIRNAYYDEVVKARPSQRKFLDGWKNRTAYFTPGGGWWKRWGSA